MVALGAPPTVVSVLGAAGVFVSMDERFRMRKVSTVLAAVLILVLSQRTAENGSTPPARAPRGASGSTLRVASTRAARTRRARRRAAKSDCFFRNISDEIQRGVAPGQAYAIFARVL